MSKNVSDWDKAAAEFLSANLPSAESSQGWEHQYSTAYQIACNALVALGYADERDWGAVPREKRKIPAVFPRWDDICISVLWLADQQNLLSFRLPDGDIPPTTIGYGFVIKRNGGPPLSAPNILARHGLGPAHGTPDVISVLEQLDLMSGGFWTVEAETILWRTAPRNWSLDFMGDPRFWVSVEHAVNTLPSDVDAHLNDLLFIDEKQIDQHLERHAERRDQFRAQYGEKAVAAGMPSREQARKSLKFSNRNQMDWIFFERWRIGDGWLSDMGRQAALSVFHDRLAIAMREAVVGRLY